MINFDKCPVCRSRKMDNQPEPTNGRQDVFYVCGCAVTYELDNPEKFEETGICENKIDWEQVYIDYGQEFDESAKLVDERFYGWVELQFYKEIHATHAWANLTNFMDQEYLDEYFDNKELYIKKIREESAKLNPEKINIIDVNNMPKPETIRSYHQEPLSGRFFVREIKSFKRKEYDVTIFEITMSKEKPELIGSYVIEEVCSDYKKNRINLYEKEFLNIITIPR